MSNKNQAKLIHAKAALKKAQKALELDMSVHTREALKAQQALEEAQKALELALRDDHVRAQNAEPGSGKALKRKVCHTRRVRRSDLKEGDIVIHEGQAILVKGDAKIVVRKSWPAVEYPIFDGKTMRVPDADEDVLQLDEDGDAYRRWEITFE